MFKYFFYLIFVFGCISERSFTQSHFVQFSDKHISYEGRIVYTNDAAVLMWPGTSLKINFIMPSNI